MRMWCGHHSFAVQRRRHQHHHGPGSRLSVLAAKVAVATGASGVVAVAASTTAATEATSTVAGTTAVAAATTAHENVPRKAVWHIVHCRDSF